MRCRAILVRHVPESPTVLHSPADGPSGPSEPDEPDDSESQTTPDFLELGDWKIDQLAANTKRLAQAVKAYRPNRAIAEPVFRFDSAHTEADGSTPTCLHGGAGHVSEARANRRRSESALPMVLFSLALSVFVCGSLLVAWSLLGQRPALARVGWPLLFAGQTALLAVVVWQLEMVWQTNRTESRTIRALRRQIIQLHQAGSGNPAATPPLTRPDHKQSGSRLPSGTRTAQKR